MGLFAPPNAPKSVDPLDVLDRARAIASDELDRIERMHQRSLRYIGFVLGTFVIGGGIIGWIGFTNLRDLSIAEAKRQMQKSVDDSVQQGLRNFDVPGVIDREAKKYAAKDLHDQVEKDLVQGPLHDEVTRTAAAQSKTLIDTLIAPRQLSPENAKKITKAIDDDDELDGVTFAFFNNFLSLEANMFAGQIYAAINDSKLTPSIGQGYVNNTDHVVGLTLFCDDVDGCAAGKRLAKAFEAGGLKPTIVMGHMLVPKPPEGYTGPAYTPANKQVNVQIGLSYLR